jgi:hypothetical protein
VWYGLCGSNVYIIDVSDPKSSRDCLCTVRLYVTVWEALELQVLQNSVAAIPASGPTAAPPPKFRRLSSVFITALMCKDIYVPNIPNIPFM